MNRPSNQQGAGLMEVLVALVLLAIGVLGFSLLQLRAIDAAQEATERTNAMNLARDLAERMRINRQGFSTYKTAINSKQASVNCIAATGSTNYVPYCTAAQMAVYDSAEIIKKATTAGQTIVIANCIQSNLSCIYVAWGTTSLFSGSTVNTSQCIQSTTGTYVTNAKCLVMEAF